MDFAWLLCNENMQGGLVQRLRGKSIPEPRARAVGDPSRARRSVHCLGAARLAPAQNHPLLGQIDAILDRAGAGQLACRRIAKRLVAASGQGFVSWIADRRIARVRVRE